jgi:hypothetical protein
MENVNTKLISLTSVTDKSDAALLVSGELYHTGCSMFGTEVALLENGMLSQKYICCLNGFFYFKLDYEKQYTVVITRPGFENKSIVFNTHLNGYPARKRNYEFGVSFNENTDLMDDSPSAIVNYIPRKEAFEHDVEYIKQRQLKYRKVA